MGVCVGVSVGVLVGVCVGVFVEVTVTVGVFVTVDVGVVVIVGVPVGFFVGLGVRIGVGDTVGSGDSVGAIVGTSSIGVGAGGSTHSVESSCLSPTQNEYPAMPTERITIINNEMTLARVIGPSNSASRYECFRIIFCDGTSEEIGSMEK